MPEEVAFYEASAQILPVLFLAIVLEPRFRPPVPAGTQRRTSLGPTKGSARLAAFIVQWWPRMTVLALVAGEIIAVGTIATGEPPLDGGKGLVLAAYIAATPQLLIPLLPELQAPDTGKGEWWALVAVVAVGFLSVVGGAVWLSAYTK
ncbi:hypothetical protein ICW40_13530 [Actinotalea ferrariae]|uniref:hypothetical protein n=1 Tax=Actinotalea ferrariae TaxID=1386098 RepID=UPI001C8CBDCB|nr:hypothetical protein [Actinotalea ferrariae]MBX9245824.1 hypothetical protein [Actinotalea ferrariae]